MNLPQQVPVKCPYCSYENSVRASSDGEALVFLCGVGGGPGCGRLFAVEVKFRPLVTVYRMIEEAK